MKMYIKSNTDFLRTLQSEIDYVNSLKYDSKTMKCKKAEFIKYISWWLEDLVDSTTEDDIAYHKAFYLSEIYKKKYCPLI